MLLLSSSEADDNDRCSEKVQGRSMLNWEQLESNVDGYRKAFDSAPLFRHVVIEDFFDPQVAKTVEAGFEVALAHKDHDAPKAHRNVFHKTGTPNWDAMTPAQVAALEAVNSSRFTAFLETLTGVQTIHADPELRGGGLHSSTRGGFLNIHTDFNFHPTTGLHRRLNLIVYLNEEWKEEWGGALELWDQTVTKCGSKVFPKFNRAILFETSEISFHGHPEPMTSPDGVTRKSVALYYYSEWPDGLERRAKTNYVLTPGQKAHLVADLRAVVGGGTMNWEQAAEQLPQWQPFQVKKMFRKLAETRD
jgi:Rps23 Pro-64 3,4-dihydroxylase Tpa1-like proline 4-hydroxylase